MPKATIPIPQHIIDCISTAILNQSVLTDYEALLLNDIAKWYLQKGNNTRITTDQLKVLVVIKNKIQIAEALNSAQKQNSTK